MDAHETPPDGDEEVRADKYSDKDRQQGAKEGWAMPDGSYPIKDTEDLGNAIHAVGRGGSSHDAIRKHIISRAKALGASDQVPDSWNADGSLKQSNSRRKERHRAVPLMPEVRHWRATGLEVREASKTNELVITGTPIVYDTPYSVVDMFGEFTERMMPGVATDALQRGADVRFLFNHDGLPLARSTSGTLTLHESASQLDFEARLDARQQLANDLAIAIERGDVSQMSCGFIVARDEWDDAMEDRAIHSFADLLDVSAVTYPASPTTSIAVAHRMALEIPIESRARLRKIYAELRAGRVLSQDNQDKLVAAAHAIHAILDSSGFDPGDLVGSEDGVSQPDDDQAGTPNDSLSLGDNAGISRLDDGTVGGGGQTMAGSPGYADGTGTRDNKVSLRLLQLQVRAQELRRKAA
jgi:HK97 family phage prohead protease